MGVYLRVEEQWQPKTFTVVLTETSDPSQFFVRYEDDAAWLTQWSTDFDEFFGYSAVRLNSSGVETAEVTQSQSWWAWKLDITQLWTLTSGDNVMIKFPVRWIKMSKSGSSITLSITNEVGKESDGFQYYAFQNTWDIDANANTTVATSPLYLWAYISSLDSTTLKSLSWQSSIWGYWFANALTYSANAGTGYTVMGFYQRMLIIAYYMMKYGNPDSQSVVGMWYGSGSLGTFLPTWWTDNQIDATYWTSDGTKQIKLFGLEDFWWNQNQALWWAFLVGSGDGTLYTALHSFSTTNTADYKSTWTTPASISYQWMSSAAWTNKWMFFCIGWTSSQSYYWDAMNTSYHYVIRTWWGSPDGGADWLFLMCADQVVSDTAAFYWSRLMYL